MLMTKHECKFFMYTHCHWYFYHLNCMCMSFTKKKLVYMGFFLEYIEKSCGSWVLIKGAPPLDVNPH